MRPFRQAGLALRSVDEAMGYWLPMTRILLVLLCGSLLSACSVGDLRQMAEGVRIQAEGAGALAEARRADARMEAAGGEGYGTASVVPAQGAEPEKAAAPEKEKAAPPPPPVYVVVPAY